MRIRSIETSDREFFIDRCHAFYKTPACDHEIPQQNAERTFELLLHGTPYADCLIAEDENGQPNLENIEDDDEYEIVADAFDELLDEQEYDELVGEDELDQ